MPVQVDSEIGRLRRVLVHRPGREIDRMVPSMMEALLFDDILDGEEAREEHASFRRILERAGVEVLDPEVLLADVLASPEVRRELLSEMVDEYGVAPAVADRLADLETATLAVTLIEGIVEEPVASPLLREPFALRPLPNYFFQRDPALVLGDRVVFSSMATEAREREPLLSRLVFRHHPALAAHVAHFDIDVPPKSAPLHDPSYPYPTLEGGDVLVVSPEIVLVGMSERTNRRGVEALAEHLRVEETRLRHLILVEVPRTRSFMHLDTVFTLIDRHACLAHLPVIEPGRSQSAHVYSVDLQARELTFTMRPSLPRALSELGLDLEVIPCGGPHRLDQDREQWTDGANAFAIAPGVIFLYRRNRRTLDELARRGYRVLDAADAESGREPILGAGPTVVSLFDNELSRARGGPRCMTMPVERDPL